MFGSTKKTADSLGYTKVQTIIGEGTAIKGAIQATGVVRIDGQLEGSIDHAGELIIGPKGKVIADVRSKALAIAGEVRGNVVVEQKLELLTGSKLFGDIRCGHLVVHDGAMFHGRSLMSGEEASQTTTAKSAE